MMAESDAARLRTKLKEVREYLNLSQQFVADNTGLLRSAIADIERGARKVESVELKRLARLYRYPISYFLSDDEEVPEGNAPASIVALARAAGDLTEVDRREVLRYAEFLRSYKRKGETSAQ